MGKFSKFFLFSVIVGAGTFFGKPFWNFVTNAQSPKVSCLRLSKNPNFKNVAEFDVAVESVCKLKDLKVFLNDKPLDIDVSKVVEKTFAKCEVVLDSSTLKDGNHEFKVVAVDGGYKAAISVEKWNICVDNLPLRAELEKSDFKVMQGRTIHATIQTNKKISEGFITFKGEKHKCVKVSEQANIYECFIPVECDVRAGSTSLEVSLSDSVGNAVNATGSVKILPADFSRYANLSISSEKLQDERENSVSNSILESALEKWTQSSPDKKLWNGCFDLPTIVQRYSTPFGEIRTTAEKGRYIHKAVDIVNSPRKVVWASQAGKIIIKERFMMTGNTVAVDHGMGVVTLYCHLDDYADIEIGDMVKKGNPVGTIGRTGYATGYHLHWELRVNNVAVDPLQWTQRTF
ncbi:M23 family metallopeptidase [Candidatus Babeliales bacterium]|nr:M23 family metallopeptidase [Candidatus Babeliales bacterium]